MAIRGKGPGGNFCSCPDYSTNELGTCKHIEFTLAHLEKKRGAKARFARGYQPAFSELYLRNEGKRRIHFRARTDCPPAVKEAAAALFDLNRDGMLPEDRFGDLEPFMTMASKSGHEFRAYDDALDFIAGRRDAERRVSKLDQLFPQGTADPGLQVQRTGSSDGGPGAQAQADRLPATCSNARWPLKTTGQRRRQARLQAAHGHPQAPAESRRVPDRRSAPPQPRYWVLHAYFILGNAAEAHSRRS